MELRDKDRGTKLEALHSAYMRACPPVHTRQLGKNTFARMLSTVYPGIGPHKNGACTVSGGSARGRTQCRTRGSR